MGSRLDRYNDEEKKVETSSRLSRNKHLYDDLNNKIGFEEIVDFNTQTRIELTKLNSSRQNRENYHQLKDYKDLISDKEEKEELVVEEEEVKVFDINSILEEARKNRNEIDELEKKRKLKSEEYNILSDLNKKYLNKKTDTDKDELEGLEELINTITSKTLAKDLKDIKEGEGDLLSDLVATNVNLQVKASSEYDEVSSNCEEEDETKEEKTVDDSFYTRSMDLSEHDFYFDEEKEKKTSIKRNILIFIVVLILVAIIVFVLYFVLQHYNISINI